MIINNKFPLFYPASHIFIFQVQFEYASFSMEGKMWNWHGYLMEIYHILYYKPTLTPQGHIQFTALVYAALNNWQINCIAIPAFPGIQSR